MDALEPQGKLNQGVTKKDGPGFIVPPELQTPPSAQAEPFSPGQNPGSTSPDHQPHSF